MIRFMDDQKFLRLAIENSRKSADKKLFPAGAVVAYSNKLIVQKVSSIWPKANHHADSDAVDQAMDKLNRQLSNCTLYCSMEPCLMCVTRAYWGGIRRIVFAIKKGNTKSEYFEGSFENEEIIKRFLQKIEFVHFKELEIKAMKIVRKWEEKGGFNQ